MSLSGQLNDLSLGELIEFFCNQRKTGRLKVDYALAPGVFFIKEGNLVDAKVGGLNGVEAIYFALTLPSASFDFSAGMLSSRTTIQEPWARVVLEGLRRIDEGLAPASGDAFVGDDALDEATLDYLECVEEAKSAKPAAAEESSVVAAAAPVQKQTAEPAGDEIDEKIESAFAEAAPFQLMVESSAGRGGRGKLLAAGAALLLVCAVAAVPLSRRLMRPNVEQPAATVPAPPPAEAQAAAANDLSTGETPVPAASATPDATAAAEEAARREREGRERARKQREEAARRAEATAGAEETAKPEPKPAVAATGPKSVRVQITYDEAGRVTQASSVGASPGAEAYTSAAVRAARGRRFPAGKAGTTVVTIPVN